MKTKNFSEIRYAYSVPTKLDSIEKYSDLRDLYNFSLKKFQNTETKTSGADSTFMFQIFCLNWNACNGIPCTYN